MKTDKPPYVYLLGVGGMGMAPLARFLVDKGYAVFGWDDFATEDRRRQLSFVHWQKIVPIGCDVCIYSPAVDEDNVLRRAAQSVCPCMPRGAFVAQLLKNERLCVVCGSHGKSTTTAYLIHFFKQHNLPVNYLGGAEFQKNFYVPACGKHKNVWTLLELDESDGTIDGFSPEVAVVLNTDWDHPRRYASVEAYKNVFASLASRTQKCVISNEDFPFIRAKKLPISTASTLLGFDAAAAGAAFRYLTGQTATVSDVVSFPGIKRRQEILLQTERLKVLSDYAHHPSELQALLQVLKKENYSLVLVFEPHRASRLKCYFEDFVRVLSDCPKVYIHPLYEAFEAVGCNEKTLLEALPNAQPSEQLKPEDYVACTHPTTLAFVGAGKIDKYARRWVEQWIEAVKDFFEKRSVTLETNVSFRNASLMGIGGSALFVCEPKSLHELQILLRECRRIGLRVLPLGGGSNVLIPENRIDGVVVRMNAECWDFCAFGAKTIDPNASEGEIVNFLEVPISRTDNETSEVLYVHVGCGTGMKAFLDATEARGVGGFEFLDGIPGTVGGALAVNAGTGGQGILDVAEQVIWIDADGTVRVTAHSELNYGYRCCEIFQNCVIVSALLRGYRSTTEHIRQKRSELRKKREQSQPKGKTLGCFFKNPQSCSAGQLLEQCGAKGKREGGIFVSEQHANFIINNGKGRFDDAVRLIKSLRTMVHERSGVWLEPEVRILGKSWDEFL